MAKEVEKQNEVPTDKAHFNDFLQKFLIKLANSHRS